MQNFKRKQLDRNDCKMCNKTKRTHNLENWERERDRMQVIYYLVKYSKR